MRVRLYFNTIFENRLTTDTSGQIVLIVLCVLMCVLCTGCMFACCCEHEDLHKHDNSVDQSAMQSFRGKAAQTFSKFIGSRHHDHQHKSNAPGARRGSNSGMRTSFHQPQQQERFAGNSEEVAVQMTHMNPNSSAKNRGSQRNKTTI